MKFFMIESISRKLFILFSAFVFTRAVMTVLLNIQSLSFKVDYNSSFILKYYALIFSPLLLFLISFIFYFYRKPLTDLLVPLNIRIKSIHELSAFSFFVMSLFYISIYEGVLTILSLPLSLINIFLKENEWSSMNLYTLLSFIVYLLLIFSPRLLLINNVKESK